MCMYIYTYIHTHTYTNLIVESVFIFLVFKNTLVCDEGSNAGL